MDKRKIARIERRLKTLHRRLGQLGAVMRGSVVVIGTHNKQPYFSVNVGGKTRLIYLGNAREQRAREYSANYQKLRGIVEEMTTLNMTRLKEDACP